MKYHYHIDCLERVCDYPDAYSLGVKNLTAIIINKLKEEVQVVRDIEISISKAKRDFVEYLKP